MCARQGAGDFSCNQKPRGTGDVVFTEHHGDGNPFAYTEEVAQALFGPFTIAEYRNFRRGASLDPDQLDRLNALTQHVEVGELFFTTKETLGRSPATQRTYIFV